MKLTVNLEEKQGSLVLASLSGLALILTVGWAVPLIGHFMGGLAAGWIARKDMRKISLISFLNGLVGGVVISLLTLTFGGTIGMDWFGENLGFLTMVFTSLCILGGFLAALGAAVGVALLVAEKPLKPTLSEEAPTPEAAQQQP